MNKISEIAQQRQKKIVLFSVPSPEASLVVFRVDCPAPSSGRFALLGGEALGNWDSQAARLGINYPQNSS